MSMTKKDYTFIAETIRDMGSFSDNDKAWIADEFAASFKLENPKFNKAKFLAACGFLED